MGVSRGDVVIVVASGDYGKPRPGVVVQSDAFTDLPSVVVALITSHQREGSRLFRKAILPTEGNGLRRPSDVMVDKLFTFSQAKVGERLGSLSSTDMSEITIALAMLLGV